MKDSGQGSRQYGPLLVIIILAAGLAVSVIGFFEIRNTALSFDGGMNAQVAISLVDDGRYATRYRGLHDFDLLVQSGPTLIAPAALLYGLLGVGNTVFQIPSLAYLLLLFVLATLLAGRYAGAPGALLAVALLLQTPSLLDLGLRLYGEVPAVVFFLTGLLLLDHMASKPGTRIAMAVGAAFGLSVLTKVMMLIPVTGFGAAFLFDRLLLRRVSAWNWGSMLAGFALVHIPFEAYKLAVLGPQVYREWWSTMARRSFAHGTSYGMPTTLHGVQKLSGHLQILAHKSRFPELPLVAFLGASALLLAILLIRRWKESPRADAAPLSIVVLASSAVLNLLWWLTLSPTSHTWLRRILPGLILQEVVAAVALVWAIGSLFHRPRGIGRPRLRPFRSSWPVAVLALVLAFGSGSLLWHGLPRLRVRRHPTAERADTEAMADTIRHLSRNAVLYARSWYQAPVLAALTGRMLLDFNEFPVPLYGKPLRNTFFVVDGAFSGNEPGMVQEVLERTDHRLIRREDGFSLYRLDEVLPYRPIPTPTQADTLWTVYKPEDGDYRFLGGIGTDSRWKAVSRAVSGILLEPGSLRCLHVDVWVPTEMGQRPRLEVRVDGAPVASARLRGGERWDEVIELPEGVPRRTETALVELWMTRDGKQRLFTLWPSTGKFAVREVGFVACAARQASPGPGEGNPLSTPSPAIP